MCFEVEDDDEEEEEAEEDQEEEEEEMDEDPAPASAVAAMDVQDGPNSGSEVEGFGAMHRCAAELQELLDTYGEEVLFPPLDGTAFYSLVCRINHSCDPNVMVRYAEPDLPMQPQQLPPPVPSSSSFPSSSSLRVGECAATANRPKQGRASAHPAMPLSARMVALRPIVEDEELLQSYIDQFQPLRSRQQALEDYGFSCACSKCAAQQATATAPAALASTSPVSGSK